MIGDQRMTSFSNNHFLAEPAAKVAVQKLFALLAPLVGDDPGSQAALQQVEGIMAEDRPEADWIRIGHVLLTDLVERGMASIDANGLMPRRALVSFSEVADAVRRVLLNPGPRVDKEAIAIATKSRQAFFLWALSGVEFLPAIAEFVIGLPAAAAARRTTAFHGTVKGPAQRQRRMVDVDRSARLARLRAAQALVPALASAASAAVSARQ
jgi:hypothetical protein